MFNDSDCINFEKEEDFPAYTPIQLVKETTIWQAGVHWGIVETGRVSYRAGEVVSSLYPTPLDDDEEFEF